MICVNHGNRMAINNCNNCGQPIYEECGVSLRGQIICKNCVEDVFGGIPAAKSGAPRERKVHSPVLTLLFSFFLPPGGNYMYLGLMKRGIFTMMAFFFSIYCITLTDSPLFAFILPIIWLAALFDSLNIRRKMENGEPVMDSINDIMSFFTANKSAIVIFAIVAVFASVADGFMWYPISRLVRPVIMIGFGILLVKIFFCKKDTSATERHEEGNI